MGFWRRNWFYFLIGILLLVNLFFGIYNFNSLKKAKTNEREPQVSSFSHNEKSFFNLPSPDFSKKSIDGKEIRLSALKGNVIILRFSRFYLEELPYLLFLEHLSKRFKENGVSLIFINSLGKHYGESIEKFVHLESPVIEDDGSISSSFKASPYETVIIGRDFKIKFKYGRADNRTIYNQLIRFAFDEKGPSIPKDDEISSLIKNLSFKEARSEKLVRVEDEIKGKGAVINLFISTCMGCPEGRRVALLKEVSKNISSKGEFLLLFGRGNRLEMIKDWAERMGIDERITVGVIEGSNPDDEYLRIFRFDIDPRIFIFDRKGEIVYTEKEGDDRMMSSGFILRKLR